MTNSTERWSVRVKRMVRGDNKKAMRVVQLVCELEVDHQ